MRKSLAISLILYLMMYVPLLQCQDAPSGGYFSPEQLDNLLAPIALYPDPLLAQVLLAATFPDQIDEAARFLRANADPAYIDSQPWDVSVKAVAHYPTVLYMMADKLDWTTALGQAYVNQSADVMASVQRLRAEARAAGNLVTTPQQEVVETGGDIEIWPEQPQFLYVPVYDPAIVYFRLGGISFGAGFAIGAWLNYDCDWHNHRVFYHGWEHGGGWIERSRPYVHITGVYVNNNYRNVAINRNVVNRTVNYGALNRYDAVHRNVNFNNVRASNTVINNRTNMNVNNKIIQRNINTNDQRINAYRGHGPGQQPVNQPVYQPPQQFARPNQPEISRPPVTRPEMNRPAYQPPPQNFARTNNSAFGGNSSAFGARAASLRGQASRITTYQPQSAPKVSAPPASHAGGPEGGKGRR